MWPSSCGCLKKGDDISDTYIIEHHHYISLHLQHVKYVPKMMPWCFVGFPPPPKKKMSQDEEIPSEQGVLKPQKFSHSFEWYDVDGSEIGRENQLRLVVENPTNYRVSKTYKNIPSGQWLFGNFWTINSIPYISIQMMHQKNYFLTLANCQFPKWKWKPVRWGKLCIKKIIQQQKMV